MKSIHLLFGVLIFMMRHAGAQLPLGNRPNTGYLTALANAGGSSQNGVTVPGGSGGPAASQLTFPDEIFIDPTSNLYIAGTGSYPVAITFFEKEGDEKMRVYRSGPGFSRQPVSDAAFIQPGGNTANAYTQMNAGAVKSNALPEADKNNITISKIYPDPFTDRFKIAFYNTSAANEINVCVSDMKGRNVFTHHAEHLATGYNTLEIPVSSVHLAAGMYLVALHVNGAVVKTMPLLKAKQ